MDQQTATLEVLFVQDRMPAPTRYEVAAGLTILEALETLGLSRQAALVAVVNGVTSDITYTLQPGDRVQLLPQIAGG
jgi:molybdopterin converting factor small subunit